MRTYRALKGKGEDTRFAELEIAFYMGWTGHYTGDGAQPLHDTVHHDGWQGANPKGYTTNPRVHGIFETQFVDLMKLEGSDFQPQVPAARVLADPFTAILVHLDEAGRHTEQVYQLEKAGALSDPANADARALVIQQAARGSARLRDLTHTAWVRSGEPPANDPEGNPITPAHPRYNPATGSAPAHIATPKPAPPVAAAPRPWRPLAFADPVIGKNFIPVRGHRADTGRADARRAGAGAPGAASVEGAGARPAPRPVAAPNQAFEMKRALIVGFAVSPEAVIIVPSERALHADARNPLDP